MCICQGYRDVLQPPGPHLQKNGKWWGQPSWAKGPNNPSSPLLKLAIYAGPFIDVLSLNSHRGSVGRAYHYSYFSDKETEALSG